MESRLTGKDPDAGKGWRQKEKGGSEDGMIRQHHQLNGHESEQTLGDWRTEEPGVLQCMGSQGVRHDVVCDCKGTGVEVKRTWKWWVVSGVIWGVFLEEADVIRSWSRLWLLTSREKGEGIPGGWIGRGKGREGELLSSVHGWEKRLSLEITNKRAEMNWVWLKQYVEGHFNYVITATVLVLLEGLLGTGYSD